MPAGRGGAGGIFQGRLAMKSVGTIALAVVAVLALTVAVKAEEKKEVTLKGSITCAKCDLKEADKCATVIKVTEGENKGVFYFDAKSHKANHKTICQGAKDGTVTGTISEKDGMKIITVTKVEFQ
jgi:hypothetical protein